ncbi:MAG TPA: hypothetical protein VFW13_01945, partial [Phenylobacterium sp.]|nr:hypothetical protein [Phenylobacterium sp.]
SRHPLQLASERGEQGIQEAFKRSEHGDTPLCSAALCDAHKNESLRLQDFLLPRLEFTPQRNGS